MNRVGCLRSLSKDSVYSYIDNSTDNKEDKRFFHSWLLWQKILFVCSITVFSLAFLAFLGIWVIFPLVFMNNISLQRFFIFFNYQNPKNPQFNNPAAYNIEGVANFYLITKDLVSQSVISIGCWMIVPESQAKSTRILAHNNDTAAEILNKTTYPVALYMHGVASNRALPISVYEKLRKKFIIIAPDHRGYGDSGPDVPPSELGIVNDTVQIYKWIRSKTNNDIYIWGHSLGTALSTHTVRSLKDENIVPSGLILEAAFTTMREEIPATSIGKLFSWVVWFESTVLNPLERNGFLFKTIINILNVDCPIMILHAEDDQVIPYSFGKKVYEVAKTERKIPPQGNVTYHGFEGRLGYGHVGITNDQHILEYIENFIGYCKDQNKRKDPQ